MCAALKLNIVNLLFDFFRALYPPSGKTLYYDIENKLPRSTSARFVFPDSLDEMCFLSILPFKIA
jgi:hypothetical protein